MWKIYNLSNDGIAIKSSFKNLKASLKECGCEVNGGMVQYVDYDSFECFNSKFMNVISLCVLKRKCFVHENEFRLLLLNNIEPTVKVNIDIDLLIEEIYVSPTAPVWYFDLVKNRGCQIICVNGHGRS